MGKPKNFTEVELEIMQVIWKLERATVRHVYEVLLKRKQIAYTTVMTMMNILEEKGHLRKQKDGRAFVYEPVSAKNQAIANLVDDFVERVLDGSVTPLVLNLLRDKKLSDKDLAEISRMIEETE